MATHHGTLFIGGKWVPPASTEVITITSATTEEVVGSVPAAGRADVDRAMGAARAAFDDPEGWAHWPATGRAEALERLADEFEKRSEEIARTVSVQNRFPITLSQQPESPFPAAMLRYYAQQASAEYVEETKPHAFEGTTTILSGPAGVVAPVAPRELGPRTLDEYRDTKSIYH